MTLVPDHSSEDPSSAESDSDESLTIVARRSVAYQWDGPPPEILAEYEKVVPGSAQATFDEWRASLEHRRAQETANLEVVRNNHRWAPAFRLATLIVVIAGGLLAVLLDEPAMGWFLGLGGALSYPVGSAMLRIFRGRGNGSRTDQSNDS